MESRHWPLFGLRIRTPRLMLRWPTLEDLDALADLAYDGIHDPAEMPFSVPWTDASPEERARATLQYHWGRWSSWAPRLWTSSSRWSRTGRRSGCKASARPTSLSPA